MIKTAVITGTGNLGTHLARALKSHGVRILQLYNRTPGKAIDLSAETGAPVISDISYMTPDADLYIFSVSDTALPALAETFPHKNVFAVHTSGSVPMSVFSDQGFERHGVLYPLQTFSREIPIDFKGIPMCIEACSTDLLDELASLSDSLTGNYHYIDSEQRRSLHLAAVYACNFTNYLYTVAEEIASEANGSFELLRPLITETARKVLLEMPYKVQTGPARRNDEEIIRKHLSMMEEGSPRKEIYRMLTSHIRSKYNK